VANARGFRSVIVMPDTQSQEKKDMLRLCRPTLGARRTVFQSRSLRSLFWSTRRGTRCILG
jgi:cysteine synthase